MSRRLPLGRETAITLALFAFALLPFASALRNGFVAFDDWEYVAQNPHVREGLTLESVRWAFTTRHAANWHPLTWLSHMVDVEIYGLAAAGHHLTSLLLHAATAALLFSFLRRATGAVWPSAFAAALFGVHPLRVESVAWAAERKDVLALLLAVLTLLAYRSYAARPGPARYLVVACLFGLGLLAKPLLVTLPAALVLLDYWPLRRHEDDRLGATAGRRWRRLILEKLPLLALSALASAATYLAQDPQSIASPLRALPLAERAAFAVVAIREYLVSTVWPADLAVIYPHPAILGKTPSAVDLGLSLLLVAGVSAIALRFARERPWLGVGWLWFLGTLVPMLGFVQVGYQWIADRYTYLPSVGLAIVAAWSADELATRMPRARRAIVAGAAMLLVCFALASWRQTTTWRSTRTLFAHALAVTDRNWLALHNLAADELRHGQRELALEYLLRSAEWAPGFVASWYSAANLLVLLDRHEEAVRAYRRTVRLHPGHGEAHARLGQSLLALGRLDEAIVSLERASALQPGDASIRTTLAQARERLAHAPR